MSNITGKIMTKAALGTLALAAVAVTGHSAGYTGTHHAAGTVHMIIAADPDNNNPGPDSTTGIPA